VSNLRRREYLEDLFVKHAAAVRAYALRRIDPATAEETVSEVFVIAWRRLDDVPSDPLPWLLACARRVLANQRRAGRRRIALQQRLSQAGDLPGAWEFDGVPDRPLARALGELSEEDRELLLLVAWDELEPEQTALALGCSRRTLAVRLHRARRRLADSLQRIEHEEPSTTTMESLR
jgi:RNA polymerase sigma-70 factor (ECF subfamily)